MNLSEIYNKIVLNEQNRKEKAAKYKSEWKPRRCEDYILPAFNIPESRSKKSQRKKLSKVLAFVMRERNIRASEGCTIMPIPTTNKSMLAIAGSPANVTNLIKFMCEIGLISPESEKYRFGCKNDKLNYAKTYRYYYDNEVKLLEYCKQEGIEAFQTKNRGRRKKIVIPGDFGISVKDVYVSSRLNLVKPKNLSRAEFENCLSELLHQRYPDLKKYQEIADEINEKYYADYPEFKVRFELNFTWDKEKNAVQGIRLRATNSSVSASNSEEHGENFHRLIKKELLEKHGLNLSKDVKSSVPRITLSLNQHYWEKESTDIYERIYQEYILSEVCPTNGTIVQKFAELREAIKKLHMRGYFDTEGNIRKHTRNAMGHHVVEDKDEIDAIMKAYQKAIIRAEGGKLYGTEIFLHESCIYLDVLKELLDNGFSCWECYDAFYARKEGVTQEEFEEYVEALVEEKANAYIRRYDEIMASQRFSEISVT